MLILQGLPASGKSTYAKEWVNQDPKHRVRINRDTMRLMLNPINSMDRTTFLDNSKTNFDTFQPKSNPRILEKNKNFTALSHPNSISIPLEKQKTFIRNYTI